MLRALATLKQAGKKDSVRVGAWEVRFTPTTNEGTAKKAGYSSFKKDGCVAIYTIRRLKVALHADTDGITCTVCRSGDEDPNNEILLCDGLDERGIPCSNAYHVRASSQCRMHTHACA
jgi:hypothetical protein